MLTFLNNIFLPVLAAAVLPILIHLFLRRKLLRKNWPSLRFLLEIQRQRMRQLKLKQILLLILRVLILLLVIGAFTRPAVRGIFGDTVGAHENTSVAILLDRSYSMGQEAAGVDLFTKAKMVAGDILTLLKEGDELLIVPFSDAPQPLTETPSKILAGSHEAIDSLRVSAGGTDIWAAAAFAVEELNNSRLLHKEIYIITDSRASGWRRSGKLEVPNGMRLYGIPLSPDDERNLAVVELEFPRTLLQIKVPFELTTRIENFSPGPVTDHVVNLYLDDRRVAQGSVDLLPGASAAVKLSAMVDSGGCHAGRVELEGDALPADNTRFFAFKIPERLDVLVVGGPETDFLVTALAPEPGSFFNVKRVDYSRFGGQVLSAYDVVILSDPAVLSSAVAGAINGFVQQGGGLMLLLGGSPEPNKFAGSMFGERSQYKVLSALGDTEAPGRLELGNADFNHPVLMPYADKGLPDISFRRVAVIERAPSVMLYFSNGLPAIAEGSLGDGKVVICGFSANLKYGGLATSGFFVPMMHRLTQYLASDVAAFDIGYTIGEEGIRAISDFPQGAGAAKLILPDSSNRFVTPRFAGGKAIISTGQLQQAGIYKILADSVTVDMFAVNVDVAESESSPLDRDAVSKIAPLHWLSSQGDFSAKILAARYGRELHHGMLVVAFFLMLVELALGSSWRKTEDLSEKMKKR